MKPFQAIPFLILFFLSGRAEAQIAGCTDRLALNYNPFALLNDGSCLYEMIAAVPSASFSLSPALEETSGLILWNDRLWTHNDNGDISLFCLDTLSGNIIRSYELTGAVNTDWEEISQDDNYIYVGDIGNNASGNRRDLRILRISKSSILAESPVIETISFIYSDQVDLSGSGANNTDFDCEAFIVTADSVFLFTKQWISSKTSLYAVPNIPGAHKAELRGTFDVRGLITGATLVEEKRLIALCGYSSLLEPFIFLLYDYTGNSFFSGNKRKIPVSLPFHQVEAIATADGLKYYITNERFVQSPLINSPQRLHIIELDTFLAHYLSKPTGIIEPQSSRDYSVFPVPAGDIITIRSAGGQFPARYWLVNQAGTIVQSGRTASENTEINISGLASGIYLLKLGRGSKNTFRVMKIR